MSCAEFDPVRHQAEVDFMLGKTPQQNPYGCWERSFLMWAYHYGNFAMGVALGAISKPAQARVLQEAAHLAMDAKAKRREYDRKYKEKVKQRKTLA